MIVTKFDCNQIKHVEEANWNFERVTHFDICPLSWRHNDKVSIDLEHWLKALTFVYKML